MAKEFDGYHKWLGILPAEQPPNHYRLLGVAPFESDADVIANAADQRMAHVRTFQSGQFSNLSQQILNQIAHARITLLNAEKKAAYDEQLRRDLAPVATVHRPGTGSFVGTKNVPVPVNDYAPVRARELVVAPPLRAETPTTAAHPAASIPVSAATSPATPSAERTLTRRSRSSSTTIAVVAGGIMLAILGYAFLFGKGSPIASHPPSPPPKKSKPSAATEGELGIGDWGAEKPAPETPSSAATEGEVGIGDWGATQAEEPPSGEIKWVNAAKNSIRRGDIEVKVKSVTTNVTKLTGIDGRRFSVAAGYLTIALSIKNHNAERKLTYATWGRAPSNTAVSLRDDEGRPQRMPTWRLKELLVFTGQTEKDKTPLEGTVEDLLIYTKPTQKFKSLRLSLPGENIGSAEALGFEIPLVMVEEYKPPTEGGETPMVPALGDNGPAPPTGSGPEPPRPKEPKPEPKDAPTVEPKVTFVTSLKELDDALAVQPPPNVLCVQIVFSSDRFPKESLAKLQSWTKEGGVLWLDTNLAGQFGFRLAKVPSPERNGRALVVSENANHPIVKGLGAAEVGFLLSESGVMVPGPLNEIDAAVTPLLALAFQGKVWVPLAVRSYERGQVVLRPRALRADGGHAKTSRQLDENLRAWSLKQAGRAAAGRN